MKKPKTDKTKDGELLPIKDIKKGETVTDAAARQEAAARDIPAGNTPEKDMPARKRARSRPPKREDEETDDRLFKMIEHMVTTAVGNSIQKLPADIRTHLEEMATAFTQPKVSLIFSSINKAMADIHPLAKTERHPDEGFDFRRIDVILAEIQPILVRHHLFYAPTSIVKEEQIDRPVRLATGESWVNIFTRCTVRYRIYCTIDGSYIDVEAMGEGVSEMHFSSAAAQTMAEKAMLCDLFCIPVYGADDPEATVVEPSQAVTVTTTVAASETPTGPAPQSGNLFDLAEAPTEGKRRSRRKQEPQTAVAGGVVASEALDAVPAVEKALDADGQGFIKIIEASMKPKGVTSEEVFAHFKVASWSELKASQMGEIISWINSQKKEA